MANEGGRLGKREWLGHVRVLGEGAEELRSTLHGDLRQQMKKQRGREDEAGQGDGD